MMSDQSALLVEWWMTVDRQTLYFAAILPVLVWFLRNFLGGAVLHVVSSAGALLGINVPPEVREATRPSAAVLCVALALFLSIKTLSLPGLLAVVLEGLVRIVAIFTVFWLMNSFVQIAIAQKPSGRAETKVIQKSWLPQFVRLFFAILTIVVLLKTFGIELGPALTGLGIAGAAIALAAQDLIRNLIAGLNIAAEQRFQEGDWVNFGQGTDGIVEKMQLRSTVIRKFDRSVIHVPNAELANKPMTNFSSRESRRLHWTVGVSFKTDESKLKEICKGIAEYIESSGHFLPANEAHQYVSVYSIEECWMNIIVDCFIRQNDRSVELSARHDLALEIKRIMNAANVEFALPAQSVYGEISVMKDAV